MVGLMVFQAQVARWAKYNFGNVEPWKCILGMQEELGELCHAYLKREQGIRGTKEEHDRAIVDACADLLVFMLNFAEREGFLLETALQIVWDEVKKRDWKQFPINGVSE